MFLITPKIVTVAAKAPALSAIPAVTVAAAPSIGVSVPVPSPTLPEADCPSRALGLGDRDCAR
jgi:hypothetical protein